jgi:hypothetical protein
LHVLVFGNSSALRNVILRLGDDPSPADLTEPLVRDARDIGLHDALVAGEHLFYLLGCDEFAADPEQLGAAPGELEVAAVAQPA